MDQRLSNVDPQMMHTYLKEELGTCDYAGGAADCFLTARRFWVRIHAFLCGVSLHWSSPGTLASCLRHGIILILNWPQG